MIDILKTTKRAAAPIIVLIAGLLPFFLFDSPLTERLFAVVAVCLALWLLELVPPFVPTILLLVLIPLTLAPLDPRFTLANTLRWAADPVLGLFFGGFALGIAGERSGLSTRLANSAISGSRGSFPRLLAITMGLSAFMSMWISNIAAAALMFGMVRPLLREMEDDDPLRRTLLVATAFAANIGGMATPVGTGPNAIAMASLSEKVHIDFVDWMIFAVPLMVGLLALTYILLWWGIRGEPVRRLKFESDLPTADISGNTDRLGFPIVLTACILLWLSEPIHRIPAPTVALAAAATLFLIGSLRKNDIQRIDWSTLLLIAGGITLGRLIESSGLMLSLSDRLDLDQRHSLVIILALCLTSAVLSSLMSNTATVAMLIPLAGELIPAPSIAILVAISASFGMMFVISTPQNAMAYGEGGVRTTDLLYPGLAILLVGCVLVVLTGRFVLNLAGIP
jgi:solute carrier family 13 (sodium-dependent dicarboxylate transporter), member 2/3/5